MADRVTEQLVASALAANVMALSKAVVPTGFCLNCDEPLADGMRWCDAESCADYQKRTKRD